MAATEDLLKLVRPDIENVERAVRDDLASMDGQADPLLLEILSYGLFSGGKRFRPLLSVVSSRLCGNPGEGVYQLAIAFEYLHLATLFHDDVIDQADTRRGVESVCRAYGLEGAILAGDYLHTRSMEIIGRFGGVESLEIFSRATRGMVDGEFIQLRNARKYNQSEDDYFAAIKGKTALLISAATQIGGLFGGADGEELAALREYGQNLGYGFQIADDLLDYLGDEKKTGKAVGNDLTEGKMTLPLILTLQNSEPEDRERLLAILGNERERTVSFREVHELIEKYGGYQLTRGKAEECIDRAVGALSCFSEEKADDVKILVGLAQYALNRQK